MTDTVRPGSTPEDQRDCDLMLDLFSIWDAAGTSDTAYDHPALDITDARHDAAAAALVSAGLIDPDWGFSEDDVQILTNTGRAYLAEQARSAATPEQPQ